MENIMVFLNQEIRKQNELFTLIANGLENKNSKINKQEVISGFIDRECQSSTAFEDGFAIPHTEVNNLPNPEIIIVQSNTSIEWESLDGKPTTYVIALLIPKNSENKHLEILSSIATKLLNEEFRLKLKNAKTEEEVKEIFNKDKDSELKKSNKNQEGYDGLKIVAVTACVVGVAHTYMAEEKILSEFSKAGINIRVETQGSKGVGTPLTNQEIKEADLIILAVDTNIDKKRFIGKKVYQTKVVRAIKEPLKVLSDAKEQAITIAGDSNFTIQTKEKQGVLRHILAGISYMIPIIIAGGIFIAASLGIAKAIWGPEAGTTGVNGEYPNNPLWAMEQIGVAAFILMIPILAAFIANSIAGRSAIAPALIGGYVGNSPNLLVPLPGITTVQTPMGFIGAIIAGLLVGYFAQWVNTWRVPKSLRAAMPIFFIPIVGSLGIGVIFMYILGGPIGYIMDNISNVIEKGYTSDTFGAGLGLGLGLIIGAMAGFDMGGPINKIAFITSSALITQQIYQPMAAMAAAIPVAPLGMGLSSILFKRFFSREERATGISALIMGMIGISEGAIPFAIRDPKRAIVSNVIGSATAGAIAGLLRIENYAAHGGPIVGILGAVPYGIQTFYFFLAIVIGTGITVTVYGILLISTMGKIGSLKEVFVNTCESFKEAAVIEKQTLKKQIRELQTSLKGATNKIEADLITKQIDDIKVKFEPIKNSLNNQLKKAKNLYKTIVGDEHIVIKKEKSNLSAFVGEQKFKKRSEIQILKENFKKNMSDADRYEKRVLKEKYENAYENILKEYENGINSYRSNLYKPFVTKFTKAI